MNASRAGMGDDPLLHPSLGDAAAGSVAFREPWNPRSMFYVAFLGGALPLLAIAVLNAGRHGLGRREAGQVTAITATALLPTVLIAGLMELDPSALQLIARFAGVLAYVAVLPLFRRSQRLFENRGGEWSSLWVPGAMAVGAGGAIQRLTLYAVNGGIG